MVKILVTGARDWDSVEVVCGQLSKYPSGSILINGGANGADTCAKIVAELLGFKIITIPAHWSHTSKCPANCKEVIGKAAGPIRNNKMLETYAPDIVVCFHSDIRNSRGSKNCVILAKRKGLIVKLINDRGEEYEVEDLF